MLAGGVYLCMQTGRLGAACLCLLSLFVTASCKPEAEGVHPDYKAFTEAVYASGNLYPQEKYVLRAETQGVLLERRVDDGDSIVKGTVLFVLESAETDARRAAAAAAAELSRSNLAKGSPTLAQLTAQVEAARSRYRQDSLNDRRYKALLEQNATTRMAYEQARLAAAVSKTTLQAQEAALQSLKRQLVVEEKANLSQLVSAEVTGRHTRLSSIFDGRVYEVYKDPGELVRPGDALALIGSGHRLYAQLSVDESDYGRIRLGQPVVVQTDAYPGQTFRARVSRIHPKLNPADQSFRIDAEFAGPQPAAGYGLTAEADILIQQKKNVLTIPHNLLVGQDSVWLRRDGQRVKVRFRKGAENFDLVEVLEGLTPDDLVLNP